MLEALRVVSASTAAAGLGEGCVHEEILVHRSEEDKSPLVHICVTERNIHRCEKSSEETHLHTVVQTPGEKKPTTKTWGELRSEVKTSTWNSNWTGGAFGSVSAETCAKEAKRSRKNWSELRLEGATLWLFPSKKQRRTRTNLKHRFESGSFKHPCGFALSTYSGSLIIDVCSRLSQAASAQGQKQ